MAKELTTGNEASIEVKPSYGLTDEEVERMLIESFEHAEDDLAKRNLLHRARRGRAHPRGDARRRSSPTPSCSTDDVRAAGEAAMTRARGRDGRRRITSKIRAAIEALDLATKPFAQLRMNRAVDASSAARRSTRPKLASPHADAARARRAAGGR